MKTLILVRHAMPQIPFGERWCIGGQTDIPLSRFGRVQASLLAFAPELKDLDTVFSSPLCRTLETARSFCASPRRLPELREQEMGVWDGLSFREIRERWPGLYTARESDPSLLPDGAESTEAVTARMRRALSLCLAEEGERAALVSHRGAIAAITGNRSAIGYASLSILSERDGSLVCEAVGRPVRPEPDDAVCLAMLKASGADEKLTAHSLAVAETACDLCRRLASAGFETDEGSVRSAALLPE